MLHQNCIRTCVHKGGFCIDFLWVTHPYDNRSVFTIETGPYFSIEKVGKVVVVVVCCMFFMCTERNEVI